MSCSWQHVSKQSLRRYLGISVSVQQQIKQMAAETAALWNKKYSAQEYVIRRFGHCCECPMHHFIFRSMEQHPTIFWCLLLRSFRTWENQVPSEFRGRSVSGASAKFFLLERAKAEMLVF